MEKMRDRRHFLPKYPDYYFKKKSESNGIIVGFSIYAYFFAFVLAGTGAISFKIVFAVLISHVLYRFVIRTIVLKLRKEMGYLIAENGIVKYGFISKSLITYEDIKKDIEDGYMRYEKYALAIGRKRRKLEFHYEIGCSSRQEHNKECYEELKNKLSMEMLPFHTGAFTAMDSLYYYGKNRRNHRIIFAATIIGFWVAMYYSINDPFVERLIMCIVIVVVQSITLFFHAKNVVLTSKCIEKFDKKLEEKQMDFIYEGKNKHIIGAVFTALTVFLCNFLIIITF